MVLRLGPWSIFPQEAYLGLPHFGGVADLVSAAAVHPPVAGLRVSVDIPSFTNFGEGERKRIRLTREKCP